MTFALSPFQFACHEVGPHLAQVSRTVLNNLVKSISILLLLTLSVLAQVRREPAPSLEERSRQLEPLIVESAKRYGIDPRILRTVCFIESRYRVDAISPRGARGLMQFMPDTARRYGLRDPHDARAALDAGARYLSDLLVRFNGRLDLALAAYNAGEGTVNSFLTGRPLRLASGKVINPRGLVTGGVPPYRETLAYVKSAIALLSQRPVQILKSPLLPSLTNTKARESLTRDFSLDVSTDNESRLLRPNPDPSAFFIEVP